MSVQEKRVLRDFPNAKITIDSNGNFIVINDDVVIAEEFFLPGASSKEQAWEYAALACKTTQNFNRTHPSRMDLKGLESKINRINKRKKRSKNVVR